MSCCGQKRASAGDRRAAPTAAGGFRSTVAPGADPFGSVGDAALRYAGSGQFTMRGQYSGRMYSCAAAGSVVLVDRNDVNSLLRTRLFTQVR
jgi:hypothetical protein